jgi:hypothetical protein
MNTLVLPPPTSASLMFLINSVSVYTSKALVASSKNRIFGFFNSSLATAKRCFSPPEIINPLSPTLV